MTAPCDHDHAVGAGLAGPALARELEAARDLCSRRGGRLTPSRQRVLELLLAAGAPVKAYDMMAGFAPEDGQAKPPTIYRALDFLERQGLVHRIQSLNAFVACRREGGHEAAFLICDCCGAAREIDSRAGAAVTDHAVREGFAVSSVVLEAHGLCSHCRDPAPQ